VRSILCVIVLCVGPSVGWASESAYLDGYREMGQAAAAWVAGQTSAAKARASLITAWGQAQAALINARATGVQAVATARATNAKTLGALQQVRGLALDNDLKAAKTFYEKRKLHDGYRAMGGRTRPTREDLVRYAAQRVARTPRQRPPDDAQWPLVLRGAEYLELRVRATAGEPGAVAALREELRADIRQMSPAQYMAARKFLDGLDGVGR